MNYELIAMKERMLAFSIAILSNEWSIFENSLKDKITEISVLNRNDN